MSTLFVRCAACGNDVPIDESETRGGVFLCDGCAWEARREERYDPAADADDDDGAIRADDLEPEAAYPSLSFSEDYRPGGGSQ